MCFALVIQDPVFRVGSGMARVLLVDDLSRKATERAAAHLKECGHDALAVATMREAEQLIQARWPEVIVTAPYLMGAFALDLLDSLDVIDPDGKVGRIILTTMHADGDCLHDWSIRCHSFVVGRDPLQILLAVEQLLYRQVQLK